MISLGLRELTKDVQRQADDPEERFISSGVSWAQYDALLKKLGDSPGYRVAYLEGVLDVLAPSRKHEAKKDNIARLLGVYFEETQTRFYGLGSTTLRNTLKQRGVEPDVSFCIGTEKAMPDLAVEVVETSGGLEKLAIYQGLEIPEVWFWKAGTFEVYVWQGESYERRDRSHLLPSLDLVLLAVCVQNPEPLDAVMAFRQAVRSPSSSD